jgi:hypothetical protein
MHKTPPLNKPHYLIKQHCGITIILLAILSCSTAWANNNNGFTLEQGDLEVENGNINTNGELRIKNNQVINWIEVTPTYTEWDFEGSTTKTLSLNPSSIPDGARYVLADVFATVATTDHQNFMLGRNVDHVTTWVIPRGTRPTSYFSMAELRHAVILTYSGDNEGFSPYYGQWYSSQVIPTQGRTISFANPGNSGSSGWIYMIVRAYSW